MPAVYILLGTSADSASNFWQEAFRAQHETLTVWTPQRPKNESVERVEISGPDLFKRPHIPLPPSSPFAVLISSPNLESWSRCGTCQKAWILRNTQMALMPLGERPAESTNGTSLEGLEDSL
jgi:hypothetical protein